MPHGKAAHGSQEFREDVEISGHIIDSLILPKVLDCILTGGGEFQIREFTVGQSRNDPTFALIEVHAPTAEKLRKILAQLSDHGAVSTTAADCRLAPADDDGVFPEGFYCTTNQRTELRIEGEWLEVDLQEMDCGIVVDASNQVARCVPMSDVMRGEQVVIGHAGLRVFPEERIQAKQPFEFMSSNVSTEKPKGVAIRQIAADMFHAARGEGKILIVGGPAIVHTGSVEHLCQLIRGGYVDKLFAGNALATHDVEQALYGTSLGVHLDHGDLAQSGHEHHLRAINRIRRVGGIRPAVESGLLQSGIMYECVQQGVDYLLAGSIRDDGPLPDVITDSLEAQRKMREKVRDVSFCLMIATTLHSVAVGNLLPAWVNVVCVDINPSAVIKLSDRGSFQTTGVVTDVEPFMRALVQEVEKLEQEAAK